ncbi:hypothetical protein D3C75_1287100 [compost metagenome]
MIAVATPGIGDNGSRLRPTLCVERVLLRYGAQSLSDDYLYSPGITALYEGHSSRHYNRLQPYKLGL